MKRDFFKIRKRLIVGCLAAAIAVAQPVSSVFANPATIPYAIERISAFPISIFTNLFILQELPVQSHQEKK